MLGIVREPTFFADRYILLRGPQKNRWPGKNILEPASPFLP
jgi:hypothetical protein